MVGGRLVGLIGRAMIAGCFGGADECTERYYRKASMRLKSDGDVL